MKLLYTADLTGSEECWKKLINAGLLFGAHILVVSGNLTGTTMPASAATLNRWLEWAESKLIGGQRLIIMPGHDDPPDVVQLLQSSPVVEWAHGNRINLSEDHTMINEGFFSVPDNHLPQSIEIFHELQKQVRGLRDLHATIFNLRLPPSETTLFYMSCLHQATSAAKDETNIDLHRCRGVRRFIETYQPLLSLHTLSGSRNNLYTRIGRTLCCLPGNSCCEGLLSAFLITLENATIRDFQPISG